MSEIQNEVIGRWLRIHSLNIKERVSEPMEIDIDDANPIGVIGYTRSLKSQDIVQLDSVKLSIQIVETNCIDEKVDIIVNPAGKIPHHGSKISKRIR
jgi:hypothetical protein